MATKAATMKTITLNGVPYSVDEAGNAFAYGSTLTLGKYDSATKKLTLLEGWEEAGASYISAYRSSLKERTVVALEKAKEQQSS